MKNARQKRGFGPGNKLPLVSNALRRLASLVFTRSTLLGAIFGKAAGLRTVTIVREPDVAQRFELKTYVPFPVVRAQWLNGMLHNASRERSDSTAYFAFQNVNVSANRRGGFIQKDSQLVLPETGLPGLPRVYFPGTAVAGIIGQSGRLVLVDAERSKPAIGKAVFAGSMAPHNWFHWLVDNLPNIYQARFLPSEYSSFPLLIPAEVQTRPNWMAALETVSEGRDLLFVESETWFSVKDLIKIEGVTRPNPRPLARNQNPRIGVLSSPLLDFRDHVISSLGLADIPVARGRRVFVGRRSARTRNYNQNQVFAIAENFGFELVFLEDLSFVDSVLLFREAEMVAGPHDAGWANLLFSNPATRALLWTWQGGEADNWYENIAYLSGVHYEQLDTRVSASRAVDRRQSSYLLEPGRAEEAFRRLTG